MPASSVGPTPYAPGQLFTAKGLQILIAWEGLEIAEREVEPYSVAVLLDGAKGLYTPKAVPQLLKGGWHHFAFSLTGGGERELKVWIDGESLTFEQAGRSSAGVNFDEFRLSQDFEGLFKGFRVWNRGMNDREVKENANWWVRSADGKLPKHCLAEFRFNEGLGDKVASGGEFVETIVSNRISSTESPVWYNLNHAISKISVENEGSHKLLSDGTYEVMMLHGFNAFSTVKTSFGLAFTDAKMTIDGVAVENPSDVTIDFSKNADRTVEVKVVREDFLGYNIAQNLRVKLSVEASAECEFLEFMAKKNDNPGLADDEKITVSGQTVVLRGSYTNAANVVLSEIHASPSARLYYRETEVNGSTLTLDLGKPALLKVVAANGRSFKLYNLQIAREQTIVWEQELSSTTFSSVPIALSATASSGLPVTYTVTPAENASVRADGMLQIARIGKITITALQQGGDAWTAAQPVSKELTVTQAPLTIRPKPVSITEGQPVPELEYELDGAQYGEGIELFKDPKFAVERAAGDYWQRGDIPLAAGSYTISPVGYTTPYADGNYTVKLESGQLSVSGAAANYRRLTVTVQERGSSAALSGAKVSFSGMVMANGRQRATTYTGTTDATGKLAVTLPSGKWTVAVEKENFTSNQAEVEVGSSPVNKTIELARLEHTVTFTAGEHGALIGTTSQRVATGGAATPVVAVPEKGFMFKQWTDENSAVASTEQLFTAGGITASKAYKAEFDVLKWKLEYALLGSGTIAGDALQHVVDGQEGTQVTAQGSASNQLVGWTDGVLAATRKDTPSKNTKITAKFASVAPLPLIQDFENSNSLKDWLVVSGPRNSGWIWEVDIPSHIQANSHMLWHYSNNTKSEGKHHQMGLVAPWVDVASAPQGVLVEFDLTALSFMTGQDTIMVRYRTSTDKGWNDWSVMETILPLDEAQDEALHVSTGLTSQQLAGAQQLQVMLEYSVGYSEFAAIDNLAIRPAVTPVSMRIEPEELEFNPGDNLVQLRVKVDPSDALALVTWKSENESIATVDENGWVKPLQPGEVNIVATSAVAASVTASCKVKVGYSYPSEIAVTPSSAELKVGATQQLSFVVSPSTAKQAVQWESSDESVATVDANGQVTAIAKGSTTITATHVDDTDVAGTCQITVLDAPQPTSVAVTPTTLTLKVGETGEFCLAYRKLAERQKMCTFALVVAVLLAGQ